MTKEEKYELIELSDLNREDNIKYISSEAQGIAITLNSDKYAPTFCKLERAYICGRRKSEKKIEELEQELKQAKKVQVVEYFEAYGQCRDSKRIKELEKENAELKSELTKKADTNHTLVEQMADLESENAELKEKYVKNVCDCDICDTYCNSQLTKAKELLKKIFYLYFDPCVTHKDLENRDKLFEETEQFLKEIEENVL